MNETNTSAKREDDTYCPNCAKPIKKDFVICPYCQIKLEEQKPDGWQKTAEVGKAVANLGWTITKLVFWLFLLGILIFLAYSCFFK